VNCPRSNRYAECMVMRRSGRSLENSSRQAGSMAAATAHNDGALRLTTGGGGRPASTR
jgi:hypothetical protein